MPWPFPAGRTASSRPRPLPRTANAVRAALTPRIVATPAAAHPPRVALRPRQGRSHALGKGLRQRSSSPKTADNGIDADVVQLETPRQVVPCLPDVSSGGRLHQISRSDPAVDDRVLPLASTTAHVCQATVAAVAAESDTVHDAAVKHAYANINAHKFEHVAPMPFHAALDKPDAIHRSARSVTLAAAGILLMVRCGDQCFDSLDSEP